jgi:hypothetical protein
MSEQRPLEFNYNECTIEQLVKSLNRKVESSQRTLDRTTSLNLAIAKRLNDTSAEKKTVTEELKLYREMADLEKEFDEGMETVKAEFKTLQSREDMLRKKKDEGKRICQEVFPLSTQPC